MLSMTHLLVYDVRYFSCTQCYYSNIIIQHPLYTSMCVLQKKKTWVKWDTKYHSKLKKST